MAETTQEHVDDLKNTVRAIAPSGKIAEVDAVLKSKEHLPLSAQASFIGRLIQTFEDAELAPFQTAPKMQSDGSRRRPDKTNPFSKEGWNVTNQSKLVKSIGLEKASQIAAAAGVKIGDTRPNPDYA
jgi:hypothetical protein